MFCAIYHGSGKKLTESISATSPIEPPPPLPMMPAPIWLLKRSSNSLAMPMASCCMTLLRLMEPEGVLALVLTNSCEAPLRTITENHSLLLTLKLLNVFSGV